MTDFKADTSGALNVILQSFATVGDGGGGTFILNGTGCGSGDDGVIVRSGGGSGGCYYRQFSGPVHLPWYGVKDAANSSCYAATPPFNNCDATTAVFDALQASKAYGDGGVTTDGRSIALLNHCGSCIDTTTAAIEILEDQYFTCAGPQGARRSWSTDPDSDSYWQAPSSIVLDPRYTVVRDKNTHLSNCFIRPSWLYPHTDGSLHIPPANVADTVQMVHEFAMSTSTTAAPTVATRCDAPACNMDHMLIAGFDTCDNSNEAAKAILTDIVEDCLVDEWAHGSGGGGTKLHGITADEVLEGSLDDTTQALKGGILNVMNDGSGGVIVQVGTTIGSQLQSGGGDTVLIDGLGIGAGYGSPVSANGRWLTTSATPDSILPAVYDVTLTGASWAGPAFANSSWKAGAPAIYDTTADSIS